LLEIGSGAGTDHWELAQFATETIAIDLSEHGAWLTKRRLALGGLEGQSMAADGEDLPFADATFDEVYSFGVIHHTDHPESVAAEMYRVMRPDGRFLVTLYNRWSLFTFRRYAVWLAKGVIRGQRWSEFLALIEGGANECSEMATVRLYSRRQARGLFSRFECLETSTCHFGMYETRFLGSLPRPTQERLARRWGWYVVITGRKPSNECSSPEGCVGHQSPIPGAVSTR
jgi:SAM-dependent methyltransferase